jgi:hypothetical protein
MTLVADLKTCTSAAPGAFSKAVNQYRYNEKGKQARQYFIACEKKLKDKKVTRPQVSALEYVKLIRDNLPNLGEASLQEIISRATPTPTRHQRKVLHRR